MPSNSKIGGLQKLMTICLKNNIVNPCLIDGKNTALQYGPLGSLIKRNIFNEWLNSLVNNNDASLFPLEITQPCEQNILKTHLQENDSNNLIRVSLGNYLKSVNLCGQSLPFGFATYGPCFNQQSCIIKEVKECDFKIEDFQSWHHLSIVFFCSPKKSMHWFHYWCKQRYLWWRKLSSIPSKFSMADVQKTKAGADQLSLLLQLPLGHSSIETVTLYDYEDGKEIEEYFRQYSMPSKESYTPSIIVCETGLDLAVVAYLANSFSEKRRNGHAKNILQLHHKLVPYKVSILLEGEKSEITKKLKNVASHLLKELQHYGVLVFPMSDSTYTLLTESNFSSFDEMSIPYTVVLNENSLQTGIAGVRNRDTTLQEQVHITELANKLLKYLKVKS